MAGEPKIFLSDVHIEYKHNNKSEFQRLEQDLSILFLMKLIVQEVLVMHQCTWTKMVTEVTRRKSPVNKDCIIIDVGVQVLETCLPRNIDRNCNNEEMCKPIIRELNWKKDKQGTKMNDSTESTSQFDWLVEELDLLSNVDFIIAADGDWPFLLLFQLDFLVVLISSVD
ncbi:uncharacterized protein [Antedon mediterranea]|uniref:uncharacterized protein n=1 Tax=Antedon mediterranea TaxID=105859 RepID=UPI003AF4A9A1